MSEILFDTLISPSATLADPGGYFKNGPVSRWHGDPTTGSSAYVSESYNVSSLTDDGTGICHETLINVVQDIDSVSGHGSGRDAANPRYVGPEWSNGFQPPSHLGWECRNTSSTVVDSGHTRVWTFGILG